MGVEKCTYEVTKDDTRAIIRFCGPMTVLTVPPMLEDFRHILAQIHSDELVADFSSLTAIDDYGVLALLEMRKRVDDKRGSLEIKEAPDFAISMLELVGFFEHGYKTQAPSSKKTHWLIRLGGRVLDVATHVTDLLEYVGSMILAIGYTIIHPRSLRGNDTISCLQKTGVAALPIVGLISFLLGLIMAFMSAVQLKQFGANIYVASLVGLSMTRELGPIMTAIVVAGRSGSAFAAEIGSMKISEEVDALTTMGFDPLRFLVMPKLVATVIALPLLTLFSDLCAILGGLIVGVGMLDITVNGYLAQMARSVGIDDVMLGVFKSAIFALLISLIGCYRGLKASGGAAGVGRATTEAVVSGIFLIILADAFIAVIMRYWG